MLVKHNLWRLYKFTDNELRTYKKGQYEIKDGLIEAESLTNDNYAVIQSDVLDIVKGDTIIVSFNGTLKAGGKVAARNSTGHAIVIIDKIGVNKYSFIDTNAGPYYNLECYVTTLTKFNLSSIMINKGEKASDVYLPNINTLPEDKQPLLPPEGDYKEITPL